MDGLAYPARGQREFGEAGKGLPALPGMLLYKRADQIETRFAPSIMRRVFPAANRYEIRWLYVGKVVVCVSVTSDPHPQRVESM